METSIAKITQKGQATIPRAIRKRLGLSPGDRIAFRVDGERVEIARAEPIDFEFMRAQEGNLADEWLSSEDEAAYGKL